MDRPPKGSRLACIGSLLRLSQRHLQDIPSIHSLAALLLNAISQCFAQLSCHFSRRSLERCSHEGDGGLILAGPVAVFDGGRNERAAALLGIVNKAPAFARRAEEYVHNLDESRQAPLLLAEGHSTGQLTAHLATDHRLRGIFAGLEEHFAGGADGIASYLVVNFALQGRESLLELLGPFQAE